MFKHLGNFTATDMEIPRLPEEYHSRHADGENFRNFANSRAPNISKHLSTNDCRFAVVAAWLYDSRTAAVAKQFVRTQNRRAGNVTAPACPHSAQETRGEASSVRNYSTQHGVSPHSASIPFDNISLLPPLALPTTATSLQPPFVANPLSLCHGAADKNAWYVIDGDRLEERLIKRKKILI